MNAHYNDSTIQRAKDAAADTTKPNPESAPHDPQPLVDALEKLRDCDWVITPHDRMDAVRDIARAALIAWKQPGSAATIL